MKEFRFDDALRLCNARIAEQNKDAPFKTRQSIGKVIYPNHKGKKGYKAISVNIGKVSNGKIVAMKFEMIKEISRELGVDPNFMLGFPSVHDEDFLRLVLNGKARD